LPPLVAQGQDILPMTDISRNIIHRPKNIHWYQ